MKYSYFFYFYTFFLNSSNVPLIENLLVKIIISDQLKQTKYNLKYRCFVTELLMKLKKCWEKQIQGNMLKVALLSKTIVDMWPGLVYVDSTSQTLLVKNWK